MLKIMKIKIVLEFLDEVIIFDFFQAIVVTYDASFEENKSVAMSFTHVALILLCQFPLPQPINLEISLMIYVIS